MGVLLLLVCVVPVSWRLTCRVHPVFRFRYLVTFSASILWIGVLSWVRPDVVCCLLCSIVAHAERGGLRIFQVLVEMASRIGCSLDISTVVMGLTVLAAGTSIPDALGSIVVARDGMGVRCMVWLHTR